MSYPSSIDPLPALRAKLFYPADASHLPVLAVLHGFRQDSTAIEDAAYRRFAQAGIFVVAVELRGRNGSSGKPDANGRETQDIVDAVQTVLARFPAQTDPTQLHIVGYSGGGGNAIACAARYPDLWNSATSFFGISQYGVWFGQASADQRRYLTEWVGGTPADRSAAYAARDFTSSVRNYPGVLRLYHDREDTNVPATHSERLTPYLNARSSVKLSGPRDAVRWRHQSPNGDAGVIQAESDFLPAIASKSLPKIQLPAAGTLQVSGYVVTREFSLWLGDGTDGSATLVYDLNRSQFTVTNHTGPWTLRRTTSANGGNTGTLIQ